MNITIIATIELTLNVPTTRGLWYFGRTRLRPHIRAVWFIPRKAHCIIAVCFLFLAILNCVEHLAIRCIRHARCQSWQISIISILEKKHEHDNHRTNIKLTLNVPTTRSLWYFRRARETPVIIGCCFLFLAIFSPGFWTVWYIWQFDVIDMYVVILGRYHHKFLRWPF